MSIQLTSSAFAEGESIPAQYTCTGEDISPLLEWSNIPQDTQSFALIMDDPDAPSGTWVHWLVYNLPAETLSLPEAVLSDAKLPGGGAQGRNSWNRLGYSGPCPPGGATHRYFLKLYALDTALDLDAGATKEELVRAMQDHILAKGQLMGTYKK